MKQCTPPASRGNLFVIGFGLCQQTASPGRLRQIGNMSVSVCLYTEQACCGSPSRHSGSSSAFKYRLRPLHWHDTIRDQRSVRKLTLNPFSFLTVCWSRDVCVHRVTNSPLALWHEGVESKKAGNQIQQL